MGQQLSEHVFERLNALVPDGALGIAVSGGGDSTALLLLAARWAARAGWRVEAATVDHGLRDESAAEALAVARLCGDLDVPHETLRWRDRPASGNPSAVAREARIALLGDWARRRGLTAIALGHTIDDQAETVLMRLARGAGVDGLSGMDARVVRDGLIWVRPLLGTRRAALREFLTQERVEWVDDPTNEDVSYERIRVRQLLASDPGLTVEGLAATADRLRGQRAALEFLVDELARLALRWGALGEAVIDIGELTRVPEDTQYRLLSNVLGCISGGAYRPKQSALQPLLAALVAGGSITRTLQGCIVAGADGIVTISREPAAAAESVDASDETIWDGRWRVLTDLANARIERLGEAGEAALAAARKDGRWVAPEEWRVAPRAARLSSPAIWIGETMVAAPVAGFGPARASLEFGDGKWRISRRDMPFEREGVT